MLARWKLTAAAGVGTELEEHPMKGGKTESDVPLDDFQM